MRVIAVGIGMALFVAVNVGGAPLGGRAVAEDPPGERMGQDPAPPGADTFGKPSDEPGERVGNDPEVPGGAVAGTPEFTEPGERVGQDPDVPVGDETVR
jgi:hypothetical protein